jgi:hypothetical protein
LYYDIIRIDMINFKISNLSEGLITVTKPLGKPIPLNIGEIVKGEVMDLLSTGGVTLKIKNSYITAKTDIPLQKNTEVMLKVLGTPTSKNELKLQFMGIAEKEDAEPSGVRSDALNKFVQEFSASDSRGILTPERVEGLLKSLPADVGSIPKDIRLQVQNILRESLKAAGQDIEARIDELFRDLSVSLKDQPGLQGLKPDLFVNIEKLFSEGVVDSFKSLLNDTGVALESKLKGIAELLVQARSSAEAGDAKGKSAVSSDARLLSATDRASIDNDLKASLLRLREIINQTAADHPETLKNAMSSVDFLLRDIETFQLLSRTTQSFYTFLPVNWQELRDGDIAFKQNTGEGGTDSFSCRLNLDLETHGKLTIMVLSHNNDFFISFRPESEEFKGVLASSADQLKDQFEEKGLSLRGVRILDRNDTSLEQLENLEPFKRIVSIKA